MQPSWRKEGELPVCIVPRGETWQMLKKGGTAGIYIVIIDLSWWIKAQHAELDTNAWTLIDDILWVVQQMKQDMGASIPVCKKHACEDDGNGGKVTVARKT